MTTSNVKDASFYADFGSLAALKRDAKVDSEKSLRAAAQQFESLFTDMMLKSMREASFGDSLTGSSEVDFYQGMFDQQLSSQLSKGKGLGLADMLVQQLTRSGLVAGGTTADATLATTASDATATEDGGSVSDGSATTPLSTVSIAERTRQTMLAAAWVAQRADAEPADMSAPQLSITADAQSTAQSESNEAVQADAEAWPPATPQAFVERLLPHAQAAAQQLGVDATTLVAHAALETGWGKHMPCNADGSSSFNLFGIKASGDWQGKVASSATLEYEQGVAVKRVERFKSYESPADCFSDYADLLGSKSRYADARNSGANTAQFAQALQQGGYATDPNYASKLGAVATTLKALVSSSLGDTSPVLTSVMSTGSSLPVDGRNNGGDAS